MSNHIAGKKITKSHSTATNESIELIKLIEKNPYIKKITLGVITPGLRPGEKRIKVFPSRGSIRIVVRGVRSAQELYVYTDFPIETEKIIFNAFNNK